MKLLVYSARTMGLLTLGLLLVPCVDGATQSFSEDFSTTVYRDESETTAWWDTDAGELKLHPMTWEISGALGTSADVNDVCVAGYVAYIATSEGLLIAEPWDLDNPVIVSRLDIGYAWAIVVEGSYAYVISDGLWIVDIRDEFNPSVAGYIDIGGLHQEIAVSGQYAYLPDWMNGDLLVIDVSDPTTPEYVGYVYMFQHPTSVTLSGNYAFVTSWNGPGLYVVDVQDPANPIEVSSVTTHYNANQVCVAGNYAYVACDDGLDIVDISDLANPVVVASMDNLEDGYDVSVHGSYLYLAASNNGLYIVDVSDPANPLLKGTVDTPGRALALAVWGQKVFVADYTEGLQVLDIGEPIAPVSVGWAPALPSHDYVGIEMFDHYAYFAAGDTGVAIWDMQDPGNPVFMNTVFIAGEVNGVCVDGRYLYVADTSADLVIMDLADPVYPVTVGSYSLTGLASHVVVQGHYVYVTASGGYLHILDIGDPINPILIGFYCNAGPMGYSGALDVSGDTVCLLMDNRIESIDVSEPWNPVYADEAPVSAGAAITIKGSVAFVANGYGFKSVEIADPYDISTWDTWESPGLASDVDVWGNRVYLADGTGGLQTLPWYGTYWPPDVLAGSTNGRAQCLEVRGDLAYVGHRDGEGVEVMAVTSLVYDLEQNRGQSPNVASDSRDVVRVQLQTQDAQVLRWELSADGGGTWTPAEAGDTWWRMMAPGSDVRWRTSLVYGTHDGPWVSSLDLNWLANSANIVQIADVPEDQGGWVRLHLARSGYDFADETDHPILGYQIYREIEDEGLRGKVEAIAETAVRSQDTAIFSISQVLEGIPTARVSDRQFLVSDGRDEFPPGVWEVLIWVAATQQDQYIALVPTFGDSTATDLPYTNFLVSTHTTTPSVWFVSDPDSAYSVDNIAPDPPGGLCWSGPALLSWDECTDEDFGFFTIYGSDLSYLDESATLEGYTVETTFDIGSATYSYYHVTATDSHDNEGLASSIASETSWVPSPPGLHAVALRQNTPNPMTQRTTLTFDLPVEDSVELQILDVCGRVVITLLDAQCTSGSYTVDWGRCDERGQRVSSGVYFARLETRRACAVRQIVVIDR